MKQLLLLGLCLLLQGCGTGGSYHPAYVITQSQVESELSEPPIDGDNAH
jgi:hypothetical protein